MTDEEFMIDMRMKLMSKKKDFSDLVNFTAKQGRKIAHSTLTRAYNGDNDLWPSTRSRIELAVHAMTKGK